MIGTTTLVRRRNAIAIAAGSINVGIGLTVLIGYAIRNPSLITLIPGSGPMRSITAIAILCCGAAVLLLAAKALKAAAAAAMVCGIIGLAILVEVIAGVHIAALAPVTATESAPPGAGLLLGVLLVLAAIALVLMSGVVRPKSRLALVGFIGSLLHSVGIVALLSYAAGVSSAFTSGAYSQLAMHTSISMAALGAALIRFAWRDSLSAGGGAPAWAPLLVGAGTLSTVFCLYGAVAADQKSDFAHQLAFEAEELRQFLHAGLDGRIQPLIRLARRRAITPNLETKDWDADAQLILTRGGYQAIEWVDAAGRVVWASPPGAADATPDGNAMFEQRRRTAFEHARQKRELAATPPVDLVTGGKGAIVVVPVFVRDELAGYVAGVFPYQALFQNLLASNPSPRYSIAIDDAGDRVFTQGSPAPAVGGLEHRMELALAERVWNLRVGPTSALVLQAHSPVAGALLVAGAFLSVLFTFLVYLLQRPGVSALAGPAATMRPEVNSLGNVEAVPVIAYDQDGSARSWNDMANRLFLGGPLRICPMETGFRSIELTLLRTNASLDDLESLRRLLDSCAQPAVVFATEGQFVAVNAAAGRMLGWSDAAWSARDACPLFPPQHNGLAVQKVLLMQGCWAMAPSGNPAPPR